MTTTNTNHSNPLAPGPAATLAARARSRARTLLLTRRAAILASLVVLTILTLILLDRGLRLPTPARTALLIAGIATVVWALWTRIRPALRFNPALTEVALRLERTQAGAPLRGLLASTIDLSKDHNDPRVAPVLQRANTQLATKRPSVDLPHMFDPAPARRAAFTCALTIAVAALAFSLSPALATVGLPRILTPWSDAAWPKRTIIADATTPGVRAIGAAVPIRAALIRSNTETDRTPIEVVYRVVTDTTQGPERRVRLTSQQRDIIVDTDGTPSSRHTARLYEQLIEPALPTTTTPASRDASSSSPTTTDTPLQAHLEYRLVSLDDESETRRILLVEPPRVVAAAATLTPPDYATDRLAGTGVFAAPINLGTGADDRAAPAPALAGSEVNLRITLNKQVPAPAKGDHEDVLIDWATNSLGNDAARILASGGHISATNNTWSINFTLDSPVVLRVAATDEHGMTNAESATFAFDVETDRPPQAVIIEPREDLAVLPTAQVSIIAEGRDDVGLEWVAVEQLTARPAQGSAGAAPEPITEPKQTAITRAHATSTSTSSQPQDTQNTALRIRSEQTLSLADLTLRPGDEVWLTALAADIYREADGSPREPSRSRLRKLRIISEDQFIEQLWGELSSVRRSAIRLDEAQQQASQTTARAMAADRAAAEQAQISEQLRRLTDAIDQLRERMDSNRFEDASLDAIARQARDLTEQAGNASAQASQTIEQLAAEERLDNLTTEQDRQQAQRQQDEVRNRLAELVETLDRGEDAWAVRRSLERLTREQRELLEQTAELGRQTAGRTQSELSPQEQQQLANLAQRQQSLAEQAAAALDAMLERAAAMSEREPAESQALAEAARRGQRAQVPGRLEQAAGNIDQNQTGSAIEQQQQAIDALEQMLEDLQAGERNRDRVLRRQLASIIESIEGIINAQRTEIESLETAIATAAPLDNLAARMVNLHARTLSVLEQAERSAQQIAPVARLLGLAADAQAKAVIDLRKPDAETALAYEQASLDRLTEALEEARRIDDQAAERERQRQRDELRKAYTEALQEQLRITQETAPLIDEEPTRRTRFSARRLGADQSTLRDNVNRLAEINELDDTVVFRFAHERLNREMSRAADQLADGEPTAATARAQQAAARTLRSLINALDDSQQNNEDQFREMEGGDSGGGGGTSGSGPEDLVPPMAELLVLRALQEEARDLTRLTDDLRPTKPDQSNAVGAEAAELQRRIVEHAEQLIEKIRQNQQGTPANIEPENQTPGLPPIPPFPQSTPNP